MISWPEAAAEVFADYQHEHQAWRSEARELASFVSEADQEGLQEAADEGLLMSLRDDHGFAGLAAATISPLFGQGNLNDPSGPLASGSEGQRATCNRAQGIGSLRSSF